MSHKEFIAKLDQKAIVDAIARAEKNCSGEIRVHVQPKAHGGDIRTVAERTFERLGMTKTDLRNGVLLFIASEERKFIILGDKGINEKVPGDFWDSIARELHDAFAAGEFTAGIVKAIEQSGVALETHFPFHSADVNELTNDINIEH